MSIKYSATCLVSNFTKLKNSQQHQVQTSDTKFYPHWAINVESTDRNSFIPLSEAWFSLSSFSRNPQPLSKLLWTCHVLDYIQIRRKMYDWGKISYMPLYMSSTVLTFMKLLSVQWYYQDTFYTTFHPNQSRNKESMGKKVIYALKWSMNVNEWVFKKLVLAWQVFEKKTYNEFHWNPKNYLVADTRSLMSNRHGIYIMHSFRFIRNAWKCNYFNIVAHKAAVP